MANTGIGPFQVEDGPYIYNEAIRRLNARGIGPLPDNASDDDRFMMFLLMSVEMDKIYQEGPPPGWQESGR